MLNTISSHQVHEITSTEKYQDYSVDLTSPEPLSNKTTPKPYSPSTHSASAHLTSNNSLVKQKFNFDIQVAALGSKQRSEIEQFIKQGFFKSYQAKVSVTMPHLLALCNGTYKAALGIRSGQDNLFIEQYLFGAIEQQPVFVKNNINRKDIVEIGHLFSNNQGFTLPLFMITAVSLFYLNYKYMVFSGTEKVVDLMAKSGVHCTHLGDAYQNKIQTSTDNWGSYYATNPKVIAVSLSNVIALIGRLPRYQAMFKSLDKQIAQTCQQLS
ncbi:thermostable hemolysin [Colwellia sp. MB02u-6]|uniref:thermostable hemolysin n=1 Tax=Colwellia sp. MB02u-6 TaxID=2759824 RepID=UPI0015F411DF|nr:thermostable hemolysin [Colwellia sp. MB02u-6]MBA6328520.1 thermostable hemolysin [Colwellia sp. MB02u-6]